MIQENQYSIAEIAFHQVGNKINEEGLIFSQASSPLNETVHNTLITYFTPPFKALEHFNLTHESNIMLNEVYSYATAIFNNPSSLFENSKSLAKHLYSCSVHPKIKGGEFYTVYFKNCLMHGEVIDAVGLFKTENKDQFLKVGNQDILTETGININKLDKGCVIYNLEKENGYVVAVVDNTNKGSEAIYWLEEFLGATPRKDAYFNTKNTLAMCKGFITEMLPSQFEVSKADQVELMNKSVDFFKTNDNFDFDEFSNEVMGQPEVVSSFNEYRNHFQIERDINLDNGFEISEGAVKKQARVFKSILKLDKNFSVYIHGNKNMIERGTDADGRKYYKLYYTEEN